MKINLEKEILDDFENEFKEQLVIVRLLNRFAKDSYEDDYSELTIQEDNRFIIFEKVNNKLKYLESALYENEDKVEHIFVMYAFKALFMNEKSFRRDDFKNKVFYFQMILNFLERKFLSDVEFCDITNFVLEINQSKIGELCSKFELIRGNDYIIFSSCLYVIEKYSQSNFILLDLFVLLSEEEFKLEHPLINLELKKNYTKESIEKIKSENLIHDLSSIYPITVNYCTLSIDKGQLKLNYIPPDKINFEIGDNKKQNQKDNAKTFKKKNNNLENAENSTKNTEQKVEPIDSKFPRDSKKREKESEQQRNTSRKDEEQEKINEEVKIELARLKAEQNKMKTTIQNLRKNLEEVNNKTIELDYELSLIKKRDAFKNVIDLFCKALTIKGDLSYKEKVDLLKAKINSLTLAKNTKYDLIRLMHKIYYKIKIANSHAHSIDANKPILKQIFDYIDPDKKLKEIRISMENSKLLKLLKDLSLNRNENFFDKYS